MKKQPHVAFLLPAVLVAALLAGCSGGAVVTTSTKAATTTTSTTTTTSPPPTSTTVAGAGHKLALGTNNPVTGDCSTDTEENANTVGSVVVSLTSSSFRADIDLRTGEPRTTYGIFMQQVPGSCPQSQFNGGTLTTDSSGSGSAVATVARVAGATTFFVQLVNGASNSEYTSDRISTGS